MDTPTVYIGLREVAVQWDGRGPLLVIADDGTTSERFTPPLLGDPVSGETYELRMEQEYARGLEAGAQEGRITGEADMRERVEKAARTSSLPASTRNWLLDWIKKATR